MLDNLDGFIQTLKENTKDDNHRIGPFSSMKGNFNGELFCPTCGATRRVEVKYISDISRDINFNDFINNKEDRINMLPILFISTCLQCESKTTIVIYNSPNGAELILLHDTYGGCVTPNSPIEIKFYLDQAFKANSVGATSAAATMYRSALEPVLYLCYTDNELNPVKQ